MSAQRRVLIHRCKPEIDDGLPFSCACKELVLSQLAEQLVDEKRARWRLQRKVDGSLVEVHGAIIMVERHPLRARLIRALDVEHAYLDGDHHERDRIDAFGKSLGR